MKGKTTIFHYSLDIPALHLFREWYDFFIFWSALHRGLGWRSIAPYFEYCAIYIDILPWLHFQFFVKSKI